ncbi:MAG: hypothetical protein H0X63_07195 [Flavobacteriales bacterium]|jgi:hypothetical protein|nr:hypothetical protein [Flavobacteriales bacterium]
MTKLFLFLTAVFIAAWIYSFLFMDFGFEIHILLIFAGMSYSLKLIRDELTRGDGNYL